MDRFEIRHTESVAENVRRILDGQVASIIAHCTGEQDDMHESVHEIRKSIKRIRAVLRLVRDEIGYSTYYRENVFYRDLGRKLSAVRNYNVLAGSVRALGSDLSETIAEARFEPLETYLLENRNSEMNRLLVQEDIMRYISRQLVPARSRIQDLPIVRDNFKAFKGGFKRIFRQGRRYRDLSKQQPTSENLHDLRKRVKYLWYHVQILQPVFPSVLKGYVRTLDRIGEHLGIYHDFAELEDFLHNHTDILEEPLHSTLTEGCAFKRNSVLNRTWNEIDAIYIEKPAEIACRFSNYWNTYRNKYQPTIIPAP